MSRAGGEAARRPRGSTIWWLGSLAAAVGGLVVLDRSEECGGEVATFCETAPQPFLQLAAFGALVAVAAAAYLTGRSLLRNQMSRRDERRAVTTWTTAPAVVHRVKYKADQGEDGSTSNERCLIWYEVQPAGEGPFLVTSWETVARPEPVPVEGDTAVVAFSPDRKRALAVRRPALDALQRTAERARLATHGAKAVAVVIDNQPTGRRRHKTEERQVSYAVYALGQEPFTVQRAVCLADPAELPVGSRFVAAFDPADPGAAFATWPLDQPRRRHAPPRPPEVEAFVAALAQAQTELT